METIASNRKTYNPDDYAEIATNKTKNKAMQSESTIFAQIINDGRQFHFKVFHS